MALSRVWQQSCLYLAQKLLPVNPKHRWADYRQKNNELFTYECDRVAWPDNQHGQSWQP